MNLEEYNLPIKFSEKERLEFKKIGIKRNKIENIIAPIILILVLICEILYRVGLVVDIFQLDDVERGLQINLLSSGYTTFITMKWNIIYYIVVFLIIVIFNKFLEEIIIMHFRIKNNYSINEKYINVKIENENLVIITLYQNKKKIYTETISRKEFKLRIDSEKNTLLINNEEYLIGANTDEFVYAPDKKPILAPSANRYKMQMNDMKKMLNILNDIDNYEKEKEQEKKWTIDNLDK